MKNRNIAAILSAIILGFNSTAFSVSAEETTTPAETTTTKVTYVKDTRDPDSKLSDGVKKALAEGRESLSVFLILKEIDHSFHQEETERRVNEELATIDASKYNEVDFEKMKYYLDVKHSSDISKEYRSAILNDIGVDISDMNEMNFHPFLNFTLTAEQIKKAEEHEKVLGIFLCEYGYYIEDPLVVGDVGTFGGDDIKNPPGTVTTPVQVVKDTRDPDSKLSDGIKKLIADNEKFKSKSIDVCLVYKYDETEWEEEAEKRYANENYNPYVHHFPYAMHYSAVKKEYIHSLLNEMGASTINIKTEPLLECTLTISQIENAVKNENVLGIFRSDYYYEVNPDDPLIISGGNVPTNKTGDITGDESVDASDASVVLEEFAKIQTGQTSELTSEEFKAADVNADGKIDSSDASEILAFYSYKQTGGKLKTLKVWHDVILNDN